MHKRLFWTAFLTVFVIVVGGAGFLASELGLGWPGITVGAVVGVIVFCIGCLTLLAYFLERNV